MADFSIEKKHKKLSDLGKKVSSKKSMADMLEVRKEQVDAARTEMVGADISEEYKEMIISQKEYYASIAFG